jgi:hypothetical protein
MEECLKFRIKDIVSESSISICHWRLIAPLAVIETKLKMMKVKCDDKELALTKDFVEAIKNMMFEQIIMFRVRRPENRECWVIGACTISDIMDANGFCFQFGGIDDKEWLFKDAHVTVEVPL